MLPLFNVGSDGYLVMDDGEGIDVRGYRCTTVLISDATAISCWREVVTSSNHFTSSNQYNSTICVQRSKEERKLFGSSASQCAFRSTKSQVRCYLSCCRQR